MSFDKGDYPLAINVYNKAISMHPQAPILYGNRAAAFMKRNWDGDTYAAMRDCYTALNLDHNHTKAHFRLVRCLLELDCAKEADQCLEIFKCKYPDHANSRACKALYKDIQQANMQQPPRDVPSGYHVSVDGQATPPEEERSRSEDLPESSSESGTSRSTTPMPTPNRRDSVSEFEKQWRTQSYDYDTRFCGHCNTTTDIKEANFFGSQGQYIVAGSDDGSFFIWDRKSSNIMRVLRGDESIVNCLQPNPHICLLATSGIDEVVRLWSPRPQDGNKNDREVVDQESAATANQRRMNADPFELMLMNMGYRLSGLSDEDNLDGDAPQWPLPRAGRGAGDNPPDPDQGTVQCRPS